MKIKLFLSSSLLLLGVWLAAAYNHTVDLSSYSSPRANVVAPVQVNAEPTLSPEIDQDQSESKALVATK